MICIVCQNCRSELYSASPESVKSCPKCGAPYSTEPPKRKDARTEINKRCILLKGGARLDARAVDISIRGIGVQIDSTAPLSIDETIEVIVKDFDIDSIARVVWVKNSKEVSKAGLRFC